MKINLISLLLFILCSFFSVSAQIKPQRYIAVTIDDLPVVSTRSDLKTRREITRKLLGHVTKAKVPAIGFVNESKLYRNDKEDEAQIDLLRSWINAGLELGNHTFSHQSLNKLAVEEYKNDVVRGEIITKRLMRQSGKTPRFFRHPYLHTGLSFAVKDELNKFLFENGYTIAPVTVDNEDYVFSRAYDLAFDKNNKNLMKRVGGAYVPYLESKVDYWERQSQKLFNREIKQILLLHANFINSDYFDDLAKMLKKRGYEFVTLEEALTDEAYRLHDTFNDGGGISWLHRWAINKEAKAILPDQPKTPEFVTKAANIDAK